MSDLFDRIGDQVVARLGSELERMEDELRERIGKPVERVGGKVIRSKPGEPPRKDTTALVKSITHDVAQTGDTISSYMGVDRPYAAPLNNQLNRPIFGPLLEENQPVIVRGLAQSILFVRES